MKSKLACNSCGEKFGRFQDLKRHACQTPRDTFECPTCEYTSNRVDTVKRHVSTKHAEEDDTPPPKRRRICTEPAWVKTMKGFHKCLQIPGYDTPDFHLWLSANEDVIKNAIYSGINEGTVKFQFIMKVCFRKPIKDQDICAYFRTHQTVVTQGTDLEQTMRSIKTTIAGKIDDFVRLGSGWVVDKIEHCDLHLATYKPISGSTYMPLPSKLANKKAIVNVKNKDNKCFLWSVLAALHPTAKNAERVSKYKGHDLNTDGVTMPMPVDQIPKFEKQNNLRINVYGYDEELEVLYISAETHAPTIHLLLLIKENKQHYCLVRDLDRLLFTQRGMKVKKYFCERCLAPSYSAEKRNVHQQRCMSDSQRIKMPDDDYCQFKNIHKMQRRPYVVYADFECITEKLPDMPRDEATSYTHKYQRHVPCSHGILGVMNCGHKSTIEPVEIHRGPSTVTAFLDTILKRAERYQKLLAYPKKADGRAGMLCTCCICNEPVEKGVVEHCHICGEVRGMAHPNCNIKYRLDRDVVVALHNLRRYDGHIIISEIGQLCVERGLKLECLPKGMEDYLSFAIVVPGEVPYRIRFIDTLQFLPSSLDQLVSNLSHTPITTAQCEHSELMRRKGVYCYDYTNTWARFEEKELPPREEFRSLLTETELSEADYEHAQLVWKTFECKNLGEYSDLYLKTDVLLLADVFEAFRTFALLSYRIDPSHYYTLPSFAWDACLLYTNVKLELLNDVDMYTFFESGIRGGVSMITHRYAKANNKYMQGYDPTQESSYITYLDMNNLYGKAMVDLLPVGGFKWLEEIPDKKEGYGYIAEVDLEYPKHLHDKHNDYPLAPERFDITPDLPSAYTQGLQEVQRSTKLVPNLRNKEKYIVHYRNLEYYQQQGLGVTKVHRVLQFKESAWMKPYIEFNTSKRAAAKIDFEKDLFKLMNNAVFGKTMENVRKYINIELVTNEDRYLKLVAKPTYLESKRFNENLVAVQLKRVSVMLGKCIYIGFTVLELSKLEMDLFHYNVMVPRYGERVRLLFTDTDSLAYMIRTEDWYEDMRSMLHLFDTSNYPPEHPNFSTVNKKVIGKMKDECPSILVLEFVGLRSKMYSIKTGDSEKKTAKGVVKAVVRNKLTHADYLEALTSGNSRRDKMRMIRNDMHQMYSVEVNKVSLSPYDDKRYILNDGIETLAYGHWRIDDGLYNCTD